jgi:hypothetical protein
MAITYPLSLPTLPGIRKLTMFATSFNAVSTSTFTMETQIQSQLGDAWGADVSLPSLDIADAAAWWSFLVSLKGELGTFMLGDPLANTPRGIATGTPITGPANPGDDELEIKGMTPSIDNMWRAGDYIQVGLRLYMILGNHNSNGFGINVVPIFPSIREAISDGTGIITVDPKGLFRLTEPTVTWSADERKKYDISFSAIESL